MVSKKRKKKNQHCKRLFLANGRNCSLIGGDFKSSYHTSDVAVAVCKDVMDRAAVARQGVQEFSIQGEGEGSSCNTCKARLPRGKGRGGGGRGGSGI